MRRTPKEVTPKEAQIRLEELCARSEHSSGELLEKLRRWKITGEEADKIIETLRKNRYVDDSRFARAYVNDKFKIARWGKRKIEQGLYNKRVARDIIREVIETMDQEEYLTNLRHIIEMKIKASPSLIESYEGRTKIFRFIVSRGYEPSLASSVLKDILNAQMEG